MQWELALKPLLTWYICTWMNCRALIHIKIKCTTLENITLSSYIQAVTKHTGNSLYYPYLNMKNINVVHYLPTYIHYMYVCRAYSRRRHDVLVFCHQQGFVDLIQQSPSLGNCSRPILIDALHTEQYELLKGIIQSCEDKDKTLCVQKLLTKLYDSGVGKDTLVSYACRAYGDSNPNLLPSLLSRDTLTCNLTHIKIEGVDLDSVPLPIFSAQLIHLDLSKNRLESLPIMDVLTQDLCSNLHEFIIASNAFTVLPAEMFHLPCLTKLDARNNSIQSVPKEMWTAPCLEELFLGKNAIASLPCPDYIYLREGLHSLSVKQHTTTSSYNLSSSDTEHVESTRESFMTTLVPRSDSQLAGGFKLKILDLSTNQLTEIPPGLPCLAPHLRTLKLNGNCIDHLGHPCNYPQLLEKLDANKNMCKSCIQWCAEPPNLVCAQSQLRQEHSACLHIGHQVLTNLKYLFLEDNSLKCVMLEEDRQRLVQMKSESSDWGSGVSLDPKVVNREGVKAGERERAPSVPVAPPTLMFPKLESLRVGNNQLDRVPSGIHRQIEMRELKLDNNAGITHLPSNLHLLQELFFFSFNGISDPVVSELRSCSNTPEQLLYLKAREKE